MVDTGWINGTAAQSVSGSGNTWGSVNNALINDGATSSNSVSASEPITEVLLINGFDLGIPSDASILGIETRVESNGILQGVTGITKYLVGLYSDTTIISEVKEEEKAPPFSSANWDRGGSTDLWNIGGVGFFDLFPENLNALSFGVGFFVDRNTAKGAIVAVDVVQVKVYYQTGKSVRIKGSSSFLGATKIAGGK